MSLCDCLELECRECNPRRPALDVLEQLRETLAALTVTVACHPSQLEALETAAADLEGRPPLHFVAHDAVTPGRAYVMGPGTQLLDVPGPISLDVVREHPITGSSGAFPVPGACWGTAACPALTHGHGCPGATS